MRLILTLISVAVLTAACLDHDGKPITRHGVYGLVYDWNAQVQSKADVFYQSTLSLNTKLETYCASLTSDSLNSARSEWTETMKAWQQVSVVNTGAITEGDINLYIHAWDLFTSNSPNLIDEKLASTFDSNQNWSSESVAIQGLPALEYILFTKADSVALNANECAWLSSIGQNLSSLSLTVKTGWESDSEDFVNPAETVNGFASRKDVVDAIVNGVSTFLANSSKNKLTKPLGLTGGSLQLTSLEAWRSRQSLALIQENTQSLTEFLIQGDNSLAAYLVYLDKSSVATALETQVQKLLLAVNVPTTDMVDLTTNAADYESYRAINTEVLALKALLDGSVADALDTAILFNSSDGD